MINNKNIHSAIIAEPNYINNSVKMRGEIA